MPKSTYAKAFELIINRQNSMILFIMALYHLSQYQSKGGEHKQTWRRDQEPDRCMDGSNLTLLPRSGTTLFEQINNILHYNHVEYAMLGLSGYINMIGFLSSCAWQRHSWVHVFTALCTSVFTVALDQAFFWGFLQRFPHLEPIRFPRESDLICLSCCSRIWPHTILILW